MLGVFSQGIMGYMSFLDRFFILITHLFIDKVQISPFFIWYFIFSYGDFVMDNKIILQHVKVPNEYSSMTLETEVEAGSRADENGSMQGNNKCENWYRWLYVNGKTMWTFCIFLRAYREKWTKGKNFLQHRQKGDFDKIWNCCEVVDIGYRLPEQNCIQPLVTMTKVYNLSYTYCNKCLPWFWKFLGGNKMCCMDVKQWLN